MAIVDVDFRTNYMFLPIAQVDDEPASCAFQVTSGAPEKIRAALGVCPQHGMGGDEQEEKGKDHRFHAEKCRNCDATVDLTGHSTSPQVYCNFCHTVGTLDETRKGEKAWTMSLSKRGIRISLTTNNRRITNPMFRASQGNAAAKFGERRS